MQANTHQLGPTPLTRAQLVDIARHQGRVELTPQAINNITTARNHIDKLATENRPVYGISTGFGALAVRHIPTHRRTDLQRSFVRSHAAGAVIVPGHEPGSRPQTELPAEVRDALRQAREQGSRMVSICTGAFVLAAAGILDGLRATTHWLHIDELERSYPSLTIERDVLYVDEGDVLTSAGVCCGIDHGSLHVHYGHASLMCIFARCFISH